MYESNVVILTYDHATKNVVYLFQLDHLTFIFQETNIEVIEQM